MAPTSTDLALRRTPTPSHHGPRHVGIIMDGNGRWAVARGLPRTEGHRHGAQTIDAVVQAAIKHRVETLTLYAFSADNWARPAGEVQTLLHLFQAYLEEQVRPCVEHRIRVSIIGRRDRLTTSLREAIDTIEHATRIAPVLHLRIAIDYSARAAIWSAVEHAAADGSLRSREDFATRIGSGSGDRAPTPDVDLIIRTGGEQRLSDFLLWESAYAELWFTPVAWPDFTPDHLSDALDAFTRRERRFGTVAST